MYDTVHSNYPLIQQAPIALNLDCEIQKNELYKYMHD